MNRRSTAIACTLLLLGAVACGGPRAERAPSADGASGGDLSVRRGDFVQRLTLTGELEAVRSDRVVVPRSPTWQVQIRWLERDGTLVNRGQKVVELDNTALVSDLDEKEVAALRAADQLSQKRAEIEIQEAEKRFQLAQRLTELWKAEREATVPEEIRPRREYQEKQLALSRARVEHDKAQEQLEAFREGSRAELAVLEIALEKANREVEAAKRAIDSLILRAPRDGILVTAENPREDRKFQVGDSAWVGLTVARIPDLSAMQVEAALYDVDDGRIKVGDSAACVVDAYPDLRFTGRVEEITPVAQESRWRSLRRKFRVVVSLDETDSDRMRPGMSVKVDVEALRLADALLAPRGGVDAASEPPRAFLAAGGEVEVTLGPCNDLECVVEEGLEVGQRLRRRG